MAYNPMLPLLRRWLAGVLAVLIGLGPLATPIYAGPIPLADEPLNVKNSAQPNIILTVDDSTSMLDDFLPDYVSTTYCRGGTGAMTAACGSLGATSDFTLVGGGKYSSPAYIFEQYGFPFPAYASGFDTSGPGAGCYGGNPPTCSPGIDPGALPGRPQYPPGPQATWPNSLKPYEYWLLWPAPAHSASLNAVYYDPRLTYDPPVDSTGASYPTMDAGHTMNWSAVPADVWAATQVTVDLTAPVTDGLWCNSDWSIGASTDTTRCRYNGQGGGPFGTVTAVQGQDYTYPWAPPGFSVSPSVGTLTTLSYAAQKVTLDPITLTGTATTAAWANAQNQKYFYENENIIWCDTSNPLWPQTGDGQACGNLQNQVCSGQKQTCNKDPGNCSGNPTGAACNGLIQAVCNGPFCQGGSAGTCNNVVAGVCSFGTCTNKKVEVCNGTNQTCNNINSQTCGGASAQTCNIPGTQTCQPPVCGITYDPPGCNLLPPSDENSCKATTNCAPPVCTPDPGTCSITKAACTSDANCPASPGVCSVTGATCNTPADCGMVGRCSIDNGLCTNNNDCPIQGGHCSVKTGIACTKNTDCPDVGKCSNAGNTVCLFDTDCGACNNPAGLQCSSDAQCTTISGTCNVTLCSGGTNNGRPCTKQSDCPGGGSCPAKGASCTDPSTCPRSGATCAAGGPNAGKACALNTDCPGVCPKVNGQPWSQKACSSDDQCRTNGTCAKPNGQQCTTACSNITWDANGVDASCGCQATFGTCKGTKLNPPPACFATACNQGQTQFCCSNILTCSNTHSSCNSAVDCPDISPICTITSQSCVGANGFPDNSLCPPVGKCGPIGGPFTGAQCTSSSTCKGPVSPAIVTCSNLESDGVTALRQDADNAGIVCRHNNKTSGSYTSGSFTYPSGKFLTPITNGSGQYACPMTDHYVSVPRHYWKSEVQWCDKAISAAGDKWLGYGTDAGGTCQAGKDATHIYPRFFKFGSANYIDNYANSAFQRVDLDIKKQATAMFTHTWVDSTGQTQTITRNFAQEMTNYANWFAYYRTRILAVKTVTSLSFTALDDQYRVGFATMSNGATTAAAQSDPALFVDIQNFDAKQKAAWFKQLFAISIPLQLDTPTLDSMARVGEYFRTGGSTDFSGASDPIKLSCQKNWHMLFTDGFTNQAGLPSTKVANQDDTVPALPDPVTGLTTGSPWPHPYREDPNAGASNAASDYAMKYWVTDLRTSGSFATDNVPGTTKDPATWQHLNFAALSLGTQGKLPVANQSVTENLLANGTLQWPQPYPNVWKPDNSGVDDLWHAAINGRGRFVNAGSAAELKLGMGQILQDITNQAGSRAGVGLASSSISLANHAVYRVTFQPGWAGTLTKIDIDVVTGAEISNLWEAAEQLHNQLNITAGDPTPWFNNRRIFTVNTDSNSAVPFLYPVDGSGNPLGGGISDTQLNSLAPGLPVVGQAIVAYLRGDPTNEGVSLGQFRVRATATFGENFLGDIVDSQAVYVGAPNAPYLDANDPGYSGFVSTHSGRPARVYVGANDGMVHAFDDANGQETWAFVPGDLYRPDNTGLGALAYQDGALPPFRHHFYVDSTPRIVDVDFGGEDWHTLMVGGLGKGGKSYYAIDVTDPAAVTSEGKAVGTYLWTFTDSDMGYTYGRPMLAKTRATGDMWLMVVTSGYNSSTGVGKIFFVDAKTGGKIFKKEMSTGFIGPDGQAGLAHVAGYTQDFRNQLIDQIYGGDLYGNLWRFDVSNSDDSKWTVGLFATLTDSGGNPQPVTTPPQIEVDLANGIDRWVFIGTGRLLDDSDLTDATIANQEQTFYAIRDGTTTTPNPLANLHRSDLVSLQDPTKADPILGLKSKPVHGWFDDLAAGQRIITPVQAALSVVAYAGTSPQDNPCLTGEPATLYVREFSLGESLLSDAGGNPVEGIGEVQGAVGLDIAIFADASGPNSASGVDIRVAVTAGTTGDVVFQHIKPPSFLSAHRMSWRLLGQ
jgi:type IV pilus assembly protein PilY1